MQADELVVMAWDGSTQAPLRRVAIPRSRRPAVRLGIEARKYTIEPGYGLGTLRVHRPPAGRLDARGLRIAGRDCREPDPPLDMTQRPAQVGGGALGHLSGSRSACAATSRVSRQPQLEWVSTTPRNSTCSPLLSSRRAISTTRRRPASSRAGHMARAAGAIGCRRSAPPPSPRRSPAGVRRPSGRAPAGRTRSGRGRCALPGAAAAAGPRTTRVRRTAAAARSPPRSSSSVPQPWSRSSPSSAASEEMVGAWRIVESGSLLPRRSAICWNNGAVRSEVPPHSKKSSSGPAGRPAPPPRSATGPARRRPPGQRHCPGGGRVVVGDPIGDRAKAARVSKRAVVRGLRPRAPRWRPPLSDFPLCVTGSSGRQRSPPARGPAMPRGRARCGCGRGAAGRRVAGGGDHQQHHPRVLLRSPASAVRPPSRRRSLRTIRARGTAPQGRSGSRARSSSRLSGRASARCRAR